MAADTIMAAAPPPPHDPGVDHSDWLLAHLTVVELSRLAAMAAAATAAEGAFVVACGRGTSRVVSVSGEWLREIPTDSLSDLFGAPAAAELVADLHAAGLPRPPGTERIGSLVRFPFPPTDTSGPVGGVVVVHRSPGHFAADVLPHVESMCRGVMLTATLRHTTAELERSVRERDEALAALRRRDELRTLELTRWNGAAAMATEARLRLAVEAAGIGFWDWDLQTNAVFYSREWKANLGYGDDELPNTFAEFEQRVHSEDRARVLDYVRDYISAPTGDYALEFRMRHRDGSYRWFYSRAAVLHDDTGRPVRMLGSQVDITPQKTAQQALEQSHAELQRLSAALVEAREQERARIAREVHDDLGQSLTALRLDVARLRQRAALGAADVGEELERADTAIQDLTARVRRIAADLRPGVLDDLGLAAALEWQAKDFEARARVGCRTVIRLEHDPPDPVATALFRIVQESLTNVARHARASTVLIRLTDRGPEWRLHVVDDGVGMPSPETAGFASAGLAGMRERARLVGGDLVVDATPGQGTMIRVRIPRPPAGVVRRSETP